MQPERIIIIGASAAGLSAAAEAREANSSVEIILFTDESYIPYYRPYLTEYIGNKLIEEKPNFFLKKDSWYTEKNIDIHLQEPVTKIDTEQKTVITEKDEYSYNTLVLANGSSPFVPIEGATLKSNVFAIRSYDDAKLVYEYSDNVKKVIIIGGGLLGLETAWSIIQKGVDVTIIELGERVLPRQLDPDASGILQKILADNNVNFLPGTSVSQIVGEEKASAVELTSGEILETDMIIFSIGIRSNTWLGKNCGVQVNRGIIVNEFMETSIDRIYACGDVCEYNSKIVALWMAAVNQGKVAGANAAGKKTEYIDKEYPAVLNSFNTRIYSVGKVNYSDSEQFDTNVAQDIEKINYKKLFFQNGVLAGFVLIGDIKDAYGLSKGIGTIKKEEIEN